MSRGRGQSATEEIRQVLQESLLFGGLHDSVIEQVITRLKIRAAGPGKIVFQKGEPADALWGVLRGRVDIEAAAEDGKEVLLGSCSRGQVFGEVGLLDFGPRRVQARAATSSELFRISRTDFLILLQDSPELCFRVLALLCRNLRATTENLEDTVLYKLTARLAKRLLTLAEDTEGEDAHKLHISQSELAAMLGVHRQAINRHLKEFEEDGLIALGRESIKILNADGLKAHAAPGPVTCDRSWSDLQSVYALPGLNSLADQSPTAESGNERQPTVLMAIDVTDFSKALAEDAAATLQHLESGFALIGEVVDQRGGRIAWHSGERMLAGFDDATQAVMAALTIQDRTGSRGAKGPRRHSFFRIGVHYVAGLAGLRPGGWEPVNTAIQLTRLAGAGGIAISGTVAEELDGTERIDLHFLGNHHLKNMTEAVPVYSAHSIPVWDHLVLRVKSMVPARWRPTVAAAAVLVLATGSWLSGDMLTRIGAGVTTESSSVAVLPFTIGSDERLAHLAEGLPGEVRRFLSMSPGLRVMGAETSRQLAGRFDDSVEPQPRLMRRLDITYVLTGEVSLANGELSVFARLLHAADGTEVWTGNIQRPVTDLYGIQRDIGLPVVQALDARPGPGKLKPAPDPEAYALYLQGDYFQRRYEHSRAVDAFKKALQLDPGFAPAWVGLAHRYIYLMKHHAIAREEGYDHTMEAIQNALEADPDYGPAWCALGYLRMKFDQDWQGARAAIDEGRDREAVGSSECAGADASLAWTLGQSDRELRLRKLRVQRDPLDLTGVSALGQTYMRLGRIPEALEQFELIEDMNPDFPMIHFKIGRAYLLMGDAKKAWSEFEKQGGQHFPREATVNRALALEALGRRTEAVSIVNRYLVEYGSDEPFWAAVAHTWLGDHDQAFNYLDIALNENNFDLATILTNPYLENLHGDTRFREVLRRLNLDGVWEFNRPGNS